jgi:hypothetical protein
VAFPVESTFTVWSVVEPSRKVTAPVGVPVLPVGGATVAVRVRLAPTVKVVEDWMGRAWWWLGLEERRSQ